MTDYRNHLRVNQRCGRINWFWEVWGCDFQSRNHPRLSSSEKKRQTQWRYQNQTQPCTEETNYRGHRAKSMTISIFIQKVTMEICKFEILVNTRQHTGSMKSLRMKYLKTIYRCLPLNHWFYDDLDDSTSTDVFSYVNFPNRWFPRLLLGKKVSSEDH